MSAKGCAMRPLKEFYFSAFEERQPNAALPHCHKIEFIWQVLACCTVGLGVWYLSWRWLHSLNMDNLWFSVLVVLAETCAFIGLVLFVHNLWSINDTPQTPPPKKRSEVVPDATDGLPISVDVFLPTYNEDPELTRYSIRDAKNISYATPLDLRVHVLDDGNRSEMKCVAEQEGVNYITRANNLGYKAGNLRNAMEQTYGDFIVILDSDTRPFTTLLTHTLGYFRDPDVAWVQTPQWFYDIPQGRPLSWEWGHKYGRVGAFAAKGFEKCIGHIWIGRDPFVNDATMFYDIIQRRRNGANASFCCGAGSIHRREAIMEVALKDFANCIDKHAAQYCSLADKADQLVLNRKLKQAFSLTTELTPYKFHVSEDIYTSILLHRDTNRQWKSVYHPGVESKMLSPLDIQSWAMQRFKYAGGSIDILFNDCPLFGPGLTMRQRLMYGATFWSYLSALWTIVFITAPLMALLFGMSPINAYSVEFFAHLLPFLIMHELAAMFGTWGVDNRQGKMLSIAFFSLNLRAIWTVLRGKEICFKVTPKERVEDRHLQVVYPQIIVVVLTVIALFFAAFNTWLDPDHTDMGMLIVNGFWASYNAYAMTILINAAFWTPHRDHVMALDVYSRIVEGRAA